MDSFQRPECRPGQNHNLSRADGQQKINSFALVTYVPGPLAEFLDRLRRELVPDCIPRAHVTVLPPRPMHEDLTSATEQIHRYLRDYPAFTAEATGLEVFGNTSVVYIGLVRGREEFERMHAALNSGPLYFDEPHQYHPHITVAQGLQPEQVREILEIAGRRWAEYRGPRVFEVETITFVQNTLENRWLDLVDFRLGTVAVSR